MSNSSATGGYLAPLASPTPLEDEALEDFLQAVVAAILGFEGQYVRPRFQNNPPTLPAANITWAAIGVTSERRRDAFAAIEHDGQGDGADVMIRHEEIDLLCSLYGPGAGAAATRLSDGFQVAQNRELLTAAGMAFVASDGPRRAPEQIKANWLERQDLTITIRREVRRVYPVLNLLSAQAALDTGEGPTPINVPA